MVWVNYDKIDFSAGKPQMELKVEKKIFTLNGNVTSLLEPAEPLFFARNEP